MAVLAGLSGAHAILLASHLCASGQIAALPQLQAQFPGYLPLERVLRLLLTFLPESIEPQYYTPVLQELVDTSSSLSALSEDDIDLSSVKDLSEAAARKRVRKLRLLPLKYRDDDDSDDTTDLLTQFLIHRAHRIDAETSLQPFILDLLLPFYERSPVLRTWLISSLIPLLRLNYEYYPDQDGTFTLDVIESMDDQTAVNVLLSMTGSHSDSMDLVKNLRGLIGPWIHGSHRSKRRRLNEAAQRESVTITQEPYRPRTASHAAWGPVNEWLLSRSLVDLQSVVGAYTDWNGPQDVDLGGYGDANGQYQGDELADLQARHGQSGLAVVYANSDTSGQTLEGCAQIVTRIAQQLGLEGSIPNDSPLPTVTYDTNTISSTSRASLLQNALLGYSNPLTRPSAISISFISAILSSLRILSELDHPMTCRAAANMCLHNSEDVQLLDLRSVIASTTRNARSGRDWTNIRQQLLWLHNWQAEAQTERPSYHGLFWRVPRDVVETEILKALLEVKGKHGSQNLELSVLIPAEYKLAVNIYTDMRAPLQASQVEAAVKDAITTAYDNASNGNRTRGGMKKAYDILQTFQPHFPDSVSFKQIQALISATHALSFYSLTLQHGVPFQPVSIRVHQDPLSLIEKVLDQNPKGYTNLDDLLYIGRNLVVAGFPPILPDSDSHEHTPIPEEDAPIIAERRVISLAISSALASDDLDTAYSYIFTRLATQTPSSTSVKDDISWRAVYNAGRYRSPATSSPPSLQSQINQLSQRMELLSLALVLVPYADPLPEILGAWRRCDEEMSVLRSQESEEEEIWDTKGDTVSMVPGGFGPSDSEQDALETKQQHARRARAYQQQQQQNRSHEEAPMGLFEVARGAAMALHKNTLPLRGMAAAGSSTSRPAGHDWVDGDDDHEADSEDRMRKRDVVSNMVTGGLASGIGWVLGAQPVNR